MRGIVERFYSPLKVPYRMNKAMNQENELRHKTAAIGNPGITTRQHRAIAAMLTAPDHKTAAEVARIGYRTLNRWLSEDDLFNAELRRAESDLIAGAIRSMVADQAANLQVMRDIRDKPVMPPAIRLRAAVALDQSLRNWREVEDIEPRISALEKAVLNGK